MMYEKQKFEDGSTLFANQLEHIEDGIYKMSLITVNGIAPDESGNIELDEDDVIKKNGTFVTIEATKGANITIDSDSSKNAVLNQFGKNLLPISDGTSGSISWKIMEDGKIQLSGEATTGNSNFFNIVKKSDNFILPAGTYTLSGSKIPVGWLLSVQNPKTSYRINSDIPTVTFALDEPSVVWSYFTAGSSIGGTVDEVLYGQLERGSVASDFEPSNYSRISTDLPVEVNAFEGINNFFTAAGDEIAVKMKIAKNDIDIEAVNKLIAEAIALHPEEYDIPILYLNGDTSEMSKENKVSLEYEFIDKDNNPISGTAKVKWQGASSVNTGTLMGGLYNLTVKLDEKVELVDGWGKHKTYCFKANAVDHSHLRNICSCKLWGEIVKSRSTVPPEFANLVNGGAIDGFPCVAVINGEYYLCGTLNTPKDEYNFTTDEYAPLAFVSANQHAESTQFKGLATMNGDFDLEYVIDEENSDWVLESLNKAIQAVIDSDGSDLDTVVGQYIDIPSAIDYYIFTCYEKLTDGTDKNYLLVTYDGVKWYFSAYDLDTCLGLQWDGRTFDSPGAGVTFANYASKHRLMELLWNNKKTNIVKRAQELRKNALSEVNLCNVFTKFAGRIPLALLNANTYRWPLLRTTNANNLAQILNWYRLRVLVLDSELGI